MRHGLQESGHGLQEAGLVDLPAELQLLIVRKLGVHADDLLNVCSSLHALRRAHGTGLKLTQPFDSTRRDAYLAGLQECPGLRRVDAADFTWPLAALTRLTAMTVSAEASIDSIPARVRAVHIQKGRRTAACLAPTRHLGELLHGLRTRACDITLPALQSSDADLHWVDLPWVDRRVRIHALTLRSERRPYRFPRLLQAGVLADLTQLHLRTVTGADGIVATLGALPRLRELQLSACRDLTRLQVHLSQLSALVIRECAALSTLAGFQAPGIQRLHLTPPLSDFAPWALRQLTISTADSARPYSLPSTLTQLALDRCPFMTSLRGAASPQLQDLTISRCPALTKLGDLHNVRALHVETCNKLRILWARAPRLESLHLADLPLVINIGGAAQPVLQQLRDVRISDCATLVNLRGLHGVAQLTSLHISGCRRLTSCSGLTGATQLRELALLRCARLKTLADLSHASLHALTKLRLMRVPITDFCGLEHAASLRSVHMQDWSRVTSVQGLPHSASLELCRD